jgi:predicted  nucleic acid-binding Zn-ribbon protein
MEVISEMSTPRSVVDDIKLEYETLSGIAIRTTKPNIKLNMEKLTDINKKQKNRKQKNTNNKTTRLLNTVNDKYSKLKDQHDRLGSKYKALKAKAKADEAKILALEAELMRVKITVGCHDDIVADARALGISEMKAYMIHVMDNMQL